MWCKTLIHMCLTTTLYLKEVDIERIHMLILKYKSYHNWHVKQTTETEQQNEIPIK